MEWKPTTRAELDELIAHDVAECSPEEKALFARVGVEPVKWAQSPWGEKGGGFWVVGVLGDRALWYNDIEEGFNVSRFETAGTIPGGEYWCNQDSLRLALASLARSAGVRLGPPRAVP